MVRRQQPEGRSHGSLAPAPAPHSEDVPATERGPVRQVRSRTRITTRVGRLALRDADHEHAATDEIATGTQATKGTGDESRGQFQPGTTYSAFHLICSGAEPESGRAETRTASRTRSALRRRSVADRADESAHRCPFSVGVAALQLGEETTATEWTPTRPQRTDSPRSPARTGPST